MVHLGTTKKQARLAGLLYLLLLISLMYVPSQIIVSGDAVATANNIASSELLFRFGITASLVSQVIFIFLVVVLYQLFSEVDRRLSAIMVLLVLVSVATGYVVTLNQIAVLTVLSGAAFLTVFDTQQLAALAYLFLKFHSNAVQVIQIFWGLWLFPFGLLAYRSGFIPKVFAYLLWAAGGAYLLASFTSLMLPEHKPTITLLVTILEAAELPIIFWLLIVGAKPQQTSNQLP